MLLITFSFQTKISGSARINDQYTKESLGCNYKWRSQTATQMKRHH